ncbi:hypothetical protein EVAR_14833_1 [Eumeta japonica]|uniref:Histone-lysine N-methyltransferase SETMAR n=1 Tax=Eumeta variegata TaxID=151549 RepID=A0A4C1V4E4_EUMVA|nr:hypothetical protein EVAR_14833_1 [Eumeta japonica]
MIFYEFRCHLRQQESYNRLPLAFHDTDPYLPTVYNWFNKFKCVRTNLTEDLRDERPSTATLEDKINAIRLMIEIDKRVSYQQIWISLGIGMSQVHKMLHEYLAKALYSVDNLIICPMLKNSIVSLVPRNNVKFCR